MLYKTETLLQYPGRTHGRLAELAAEELWQRRRQRRDGQLLWRRGHAQGPRRRQGANLNPKLIT